MDDQSTGEGRLVHAKARTLRTHYKEHEERHSRKRCARLTDAIQNQVRAAKH